MNVVNQKSTRPQDKPRRLGELSAEDQRRIYAVYPELKRDGRERERQPYW